MKIGIIGGGSWGSTLGQVLVDNGHDVFVQDINKAAVDAMNATHKHPFFDLQLPESMKATTSLEEVCNYSDILLLSLPTSVTRSVLENMKKIIKTPKTLINVSKGIEPGTSLTMSQVAQEVLGDNLIKSFVTLAGPSHAEEVIERKFTALVSSSLDNEAALLVQQLFSNDQYMRVYTSNDIIGVEVSGAVKNVIAIISGIAFGLGLGENARAALISRGALEILALVNVLGGSRDTVYGLAGIGDLIVTASSFNSRNFQAGLKIGKGEEVDSVIRNSKMVVEGARTVKSCFEIAEKHNLESPLIRLIHKVLYEDGDVAECFSILLNRKLKSE